MKSLHRYSAPQSPIVAIISLLFVFFSTASIASLSASVKRKPKAFWLSSGCSETPNRVPEHEITFCLNTLASRKWKGVTYQDCANKGVIKDPTGGNVGDAQTSMEIPNNPQDAQQILERLPIGPSFHYHIEVLRDGGELRKPRLSAISRSSKSPPCAERE
jgi:hypothetical protein